MKHVSAQPLSARHSASHAIDLRAVNKRFGRYSAVTDLDLTVERGEVMGFLGPNGAGKTTTIRLLTGFLRPSSGNVYVLDQAMADTRAALRARQELGFVPDVAGLDPSATGTQLLDELARLQRRPTADRQRLCDALDLAPRDLQRPIGTLSRGTRQKINIVQGMQHRPALLILDEPTEGLDPLSKQALFDLLRQANRDGTTIFFSSHVLSEVEELCDRVALIRNGRLIAVDQIAALRQQLTRRVTLSLAADAPAHVRDLIQSLPGVTNLRFEHGAWHFRIAAVQPLVQLLATLPVQDLTITPPSLADVFLQLYHADESADA